MSSITEPENKAVVHGIVISLSPMKTDSKKCFDGYISDSRKKIRYVGFNQEQEDKLAEITKGGEPIVLTNCSVNKARFGEGLELIVKDQTQIDKSQKKFDFEVKEVLVHDTSEPKELPINQLKEQVPFQRVTINAKVLEIGDTSELDDGRKVQQVVVADNTASVEVSLWQEFVEAVSVGKSYRLESLMVKIFNDKVTLFTPRQNVFIKQIENLQDVVTTVHSVKRTKTLPNAKVIAVSDFSSGLLCISCSSGYVEPIQSNQDYGRCTHCPTTVMLNTCNIQVSALLTLVSGKFQQIKLSASNNILASIAQLPLGEVTDVSLLSAPEFTVVYNNNMTIVEVKRD